MKSALNGLFRKKSLDRMILDADGNTDEHPTGLTRSLSAMNLTLFGIGAIIGAGIFSITGTAAANYAGPGIVYSFILGGILCAFAGLCYSEMAAMVPVSGSAYAYSYATLGELVAWIIGWDLILEYAFGSITVSIAWSGYLLSLFTKTLGIPINNSVLLYTKGPWEMVTLLDGTSVPGIWNVPASLICLFVGFVIYRGIKNSSLVNNIIVYIKVAIILTVIIIGWGVINPENWIANPAATGLARLVPPSGMSIRGGAEFMSYGWQGVLTGAGVVFFAYIGFDAISTTAQEAKNPQRTLPIGILGSLVICTVIYVLMSLVMTGVVPYKELGVSDPVAVAIDRIVSLRGWSTTTQHTLSFLVKLGALAGLTSVILVLTLGQTRIFYSMAKDGLLPWFSNIHPKFKTPSTATIVTTLFISICGGLMPMSAVGEMVSIGTLLAFFLVCIGIPILRMKDPTRPRPFKTPVYWVTSILGAGTCLFVMQGLPGDTWIRLFVWLFIGFFIYFIYGIKHSRLRKS